MEITIRKNIFGIRFQTIIFWLLIILAFLVLIFPILWMFLAAFKVDAELFKSPPSLLPRDLTFEAFKYLFGNARYMRMMLNSYLLSTIITLFCILLAFPAAYGFSRFDIRGKNSILIVTLILQMFPPVSLMIPYYNIMAKIGLYDTYLGLIIADSSFILPFCLWMLKSYLDTIPTELEEAAKIDGANWITVFTKVLMPLSLPGMISTGIFAFLAAWNEYMFAVILTKGGKIAPITVGIGEFFGLYTVRWSQMSALAVLASIPLLIIFIFLQRYLVEGMMAGAVK